MKLISDRVIDQYQVTENKASGIRYLPLPINFN